MKNKPESLLILLFLFCLTAGIQYTENDPRIFASNETSSDGHPFLVSVTTDRGHVCAGFIYNQYFVVTLASCVIGKTPGDVRVIVGQHSLSSYEDHEQSMQISTITPHENFDSNTKLNDIALLETTKAIVFNEYVNFIYFNGFDPNVSNFLYVFGWGAVEPGGIFSDDPRHATFHYRSDCREFSLNEEYYPNYMFCVGEEPNAPNNGTVAYLCNYDEGSPGIQLISDNEYYAVGLASKHLTCGNDVDNINAAIFTKLSAYYSWLFRNAGAQPTREAN